MSDEYEPLPEPAERAKERALRRTAEQLATLAKVGSFQYLVKELEKKAEQMKATLVALMMNGEDFKRLQRQSDYERGYIDGMKYVSAVVAGAENKLRQLDQGEEPDEPEEDRWSYDDTE